MSSTVYKRMLSNKDERERKKMQGVFFQGVEFFKKRTLFFSFLCPCFTQIMRQGGIFVFHFKGKISFAGLDENLFLREEASILERHRWVHSEEHPFRKVGHQVVLFGWEALAVDILDHRLKENIICQVRLILRTQPALTGCKKKSKQAPLQEEDPFRHAFFVSFKMGNEGPPFT